MIALPEKGQAENNREIRGAEKESLLSVLSSVLQQNRIAIIYYSRRDGIRAAESVALRYDDDGVLVVAFP